MEMMNFLTEFFREATRINGSGFGGADEHRRILKAMKRKNGDEAGRLMEAHILRWNQMNPNKESDDPADDSHG
jgi:DNA-binding GntR family transcriptional regulator